jgi:hypothetical protein
VKIKSEDKSVQKTRIKATSKEVFNQLKGFSLKDINNENLLRKKNERKLNYEKFEIIDKSITDKSVTGKDSVTDKSVTDESLNLKKNEMNISGQIKDLESEKIEPILGIKDSSQETIPQILIPVPQVLTPVPPKIAVSSIASVFKQFPSTAAPRGVSDAKAKLRNAIQANNTAQANKTSTLANPTSTTINPSPSNIELDSDSADLSAIPLRRNYNYKTPLKTPNTPLNTLNTLLDAPTKIINIPTESSTVMPVSYVSTDVSTDLNTDESAISVNDIIGNNGIKATPMSETSVDIPIERTVRKPVSTSAERVARAVAEAVRRANMSKSGESGTGVEVEVVRNSGLVNTDLLNTELIDTDLINTDLVSGKMKKDSPEMAAHMAKLRSMRKSKGEMVEGEGGGNGDLIDASEATEVHIHLYIYIHIHIYIYKYKYAEKK